MSVRRIRAARAGARSRLDRLATEIHALPPLAAEQGQAMNCLLLGASAVERGDSLEQIENGDQLAIAGLHLTRAARISAGQAPGPTPPRLTPAPKRSRRAQHHYPGAGNLGATADAEWPIPAGWYSDPWWRAVMTTGNDAGGPGLGSMMLFDDEFPG